MIYGDIMKCIVKEDFSCWDEKDRIGFLLPRKTVNERLEVPKGFDVGTVHSDLDEIVEIRAVQDYEMGVWEEDTPKGRVITKTLDYKDFKELFPEVAMKTFFAHKIFKKDGKYYSTN